MDCLWRASQAGEVLASRQKREQEGSWWLLSIYSGPLACRNCSFVCDLAAGKGRKSPWLLCSCTNSHLGFGGTNQSQQRVPSSPKNVNNNNNRGGILRWHHARGKQWILTLIMTGYCDYSKFLGIHRGQLIKYHQDRPNSSWLNKEARVISACLCWKFAALQGHSYNLFLFLCLLPLLKQLSIILFSSSSSVCFTCRSTSISLPRGSGHSIFSRNDWLVVVFFAVHCTLSNHLHIHNLKPLVFFCLLLS